MKIDVFSMVFLWFYRKPFFSSTRLALGFFQFGIDIGCGLKGTRFPRDVAAVPPVVETVSL